MIISFSFKQAFRLLLSLDIKGCGEFTFGLKLCILASETSDGPSNMCHFASGGIRRGEGPKATWFRCRSLLLLEV